MNTWILVTMMLLMAAWAQADDHPRLHGLTHHSGGDDPVTIENLRTNCVSGQVVKGIGSNLLACGTDTGDSSCQYVTTANCASLPDATEQNLGSEVIMRDVLANRPDFGVKGRLFFASNENEKCYYDTGSAWVNCAPPTAISSSSAGFLDTNSLTCGSGASGKIAVNDSTPLQYCDGQSTSVKKYAADGTATGAATTLALTPTPTLCASGLYARGIDTAGNAAGCTAAGGSSLTVKESDNSPSVSNVTTINVTNGRLTDNGGGVVTMNFVDPQILFSSARSAPTCANGRWFIGAGAYMLFGEVLLAIDYVYHLADGAAACFSNSSDYTLLQALGGNGPRFPAGTIKNLGVSFRSLTISTTTVVTLYKNGTATALTCTVSSATSGSCADTTNSVSVAAGDSLAIFVDPAATNVYLSANGVIMVQAQFIPS